MAIGSAACGDRAALPVGVVAASFVARAHVFYALPALVAAAALVAVVVVRALPSIRSWALSLGLGLLLRTPPLLHELRPGPSNIAGLLRAGTGGGEGEPALEFSATAQLADTLLNFRWLDRTPPPGFELIARVDAVADAPRTGRRNTVLFERPQHVAVFVASEPGRDRRRRPAP